jgi:hypothetical protein
MQFVFPGEPDSAPHGITPLKAAQSLYLIVFYVNISLLSHGIKSFLSVSNKPSFGRPDETNHSCSNGLFLSVNKFSVHLNLSPFHKDKYEL